MSMRFDIITIFPDIFDSYLGESIIKRARAQGILDIRIHDLRRYSRDKKHKKVDDRPYGGGPGMVMAAPPLARAVSSILGAGNRRSKTADKTLLILLSAAGKQFDAETAAKWAKEYERIMMIAGRYEGVDERIKKMYKIEEIFIGPYVLTGGELPALVVIDAVARHIPGVLGAHESLEEKRYGIGVPVYTRPEVFGWRGKKYRVPRILLSGHRKKIDEWRKGRQERKTQRK